MKRSAASLYLEDIQDWFRMTKSQADRAMGQIDDATFFATLGPESNSIAILVKHIAGNMRSRWREVFLTTDGEKPDRNRDQEFLIGVNDTRHALMQQWEEGWVQLFDALAALTEDELAGSVVIRAEPYLILRAINRQLQHYAYHVGQIVLLAKVARGAEWETLSIPCGGSARFNRQMQRRQQG